MKKWSTPTIESLDITCTEQGKNIKSDYDEIRIDQNGKYWVSFASGKDSKPELDGEVEVK